LNKFRAFCILCVTSSPDRLEGLSGRARRHRPSRRGWTTKIAATSSRRLRWHPPSTTHSSMRHSPTLTCSPLTSSNALTLLPATRGNDLLNRLTTAPRRHQLPHDLIRTSIDRRHASPCTASPPRAQVMTHGWGRSTGSYWYSKHSAIPGLGTSQLQSGHPEEPAEIAHSPWHGRDATS
jgi:hypothetical protein